MKKIELFYQGAGVADVNHLQVDAELALSAVKAKLREKHPELAADFHLFTEESDAPLLDDVLVGDQTTSSSLSLQAAKCSRVAVTVKFNGTPVSNDFGPGKPLAQIKRWAAEKFGIARDEQGELVLQLAGTHDQPTESTHVGSLVVTNCAVVFDLLPKQRVNGGDP